MAGNNTLLQFWPLSPLGTLAGSMRTLLDLAGLLFMMPLLVFVLYLLVACIVALWRRHIRHAVSSLLAIAAIPLCAMVVIAVPLFDPWLWYAVLDGAHLKERFTSDQSSDQPKFAIIEIRDVSTGIVGSGNHFVALVYDESDAVELPPDKRPAIWRDRSLWPAVGFTPIPRGQRLYGHFFKVDVWD
jgi:hypothetical protein